MPKITPFLWFDNNAGEAADFYLSIFPDAKKTAELRTNAAGPGPAGTLLTVALELQGQSVTFMNGGPGHPLTEAFSFVVACKDQAELDHYWEQLNAAPMACGWTRDKFGVSWQVVPENIAELVNNPGGMKAMMGMIKLDIAALEAAGNQ